MARSHQRFILILVILTALSLVMSCTGYREIWEVERYAVEWEEEITLPADHWHYRYDNPDSSWKCAYFPADTFCWVHRDTLVMRRYMGTEKISRNELKWYRNGR